MLNQQPLLALGFTALENDVYVFLLGESPATGYRVAQAIGKPVANTYKAIESLAGKGAVLVDDGEARQVRAVRPDELLGRLRREFSSRAAAAEDALAQLHERSEDERVYSLRTRGQALERARAMLAGARKTVAVDSYPQVLGELRTALIDTAARGVAVGVTSYAPIEIPGAEVVVHARPQLALRLFPGEQFTLVTDAQEHLVAFFRDSDGEPRQAIWSGSRFLSIQYHDGLICMMLTQTFDALLQGRITLEEARRQRERLRPHSILCTPGLEQFVGHSQDEIAEFVRDSGTQ